MCFSVQNFASVRILISVKTLSSFMFVSPTRLVLCPTNVSFFTDHVTPLQSILKDTPTLT